jgi:hypothetical protein
MCKIELSYPKNDEYYTGVQSSKVAMAIAKKFPKSRITEEIVDGQVVYSGYVSERGIVFPEPEHPFSDGRITQEKLQEIMSIIPN